MKKFFAVLLSSFLGLSACGHSDHSDKKDSDKSSSKSESKKSNKKDSKGDKKVNNAKDDIKIVN